jgi:predicted transcriptional regulator
MTLDPAMEDQLTSRSSKDISHEIVDRRSRIETFFDVLCTIGSGIEKPTHIMYNANLSWTVMQYYTERLVSKGLAAFEESDGKRRYRLTEKGKGVMQQYLSIKEDLDIISEKRK